MLTVLPISASDILLYMNIFFIALIVLGALIGFIRGTRKSLLHLVVWGALFLLGLFGINLIASKVLNYDLSSYNLSLNGISITTINEFIQTYLIQNFPDYFNAEMLKEGTDANALINGVSMFAFKIVFWIVWLILIFILSQLIDAILWLFIKPKKKKVNGKKVKPKKSMASRLGGLGIGTFRGLVTLLLVAFLFAGLSSIASSIKKLSEEEVDISVICTYDDIVLLNLSETSSSTNSIDQYLEEYNDVIEVLEGYKGTVAGKIFGVIKIGEDKTSIDEQVFDSLFKIDGKNQSIKIRKEINDLVTILQNDAVKKILTDGFELADLASINKDTLKEAIDVLSSLDTIKVIVPVGVELITYTDVLSNVLGEEYSTIHDRLLENINNLQDIEYGEEFKKLGYSFVDFVDLVGNGLTDLANVDYLNLDADKLRTLIDNLTNMELIDVVAPIAVSYIISSDAMTNALSEAGFSVEDLKLEEIMNTENFFTHELKCIPDLYKSIQDLGLKIVDGQIDLTEADENKVDALVDNLFDFYIVDNASNVVASTLYKKFVPDDYKNLISDDELLSTNWKEELAPILTASVSLLKTDIINSSDPLDTISKMNDEDFESLGKYLAQSKLLCNHMNDLIDILTKNVNVEGLTLVGLDENENEYWNENEIVSLLKSFKVIINAGLLQSDVSIETVKKIEDSVIEELSSSISKSQFVTKNLSSLISTFTKDLEFNVATLEKEDWTKSEIYSVFKSLKTIALSSTGDSINVVDLLNLSSDDINIVLESKFIRLTFKNVLYDMSQEGKELEILKGIYNDDSHYLWNDERISKNFEVSSSGINITGNNDCIEYIIYKNDIYFASTSSLNYEFNSDYTYDENDTFKVEGIKTCGELRNVVNAITCLEIKDIDNISIDLRDVINNKDKLFKSYIIVETLVDQIRKQESLVTIPDDYKEGGTGIWKDVNGVEGELSRIISALDVALGISTSSEPVLIDSISTDSISLQNIIDNKAIIMKSDIITATVVKKIQDLGSDGTIKLPSEYQTNDYLIWKDSSEKQGELTILLDALSNIITLPETGFNITVNDITISKVLASKNEILSSAVLTATIVDKITSLDTLITVPEDYKITDESYSTGYTKWKGTDGELSKIINSFDYIVVNKDMTIDTITVDDISFKQIIDNQTEVFKSEILTATVVKKIQDLGNDGTIVVPIEYQGDYAIWQGTNKELSLLLEAINKLDIIPATGFEININDLTISKITTNADSLTASAILSATLIDKVSSLSSVITIPSKYSVSSTHSWESDYSEWKDNSELNNLIKSLDYIVVNKDMTIDTITVDDISFKQIIDNQTEVFKSEILTATVVKKIQDLGSEGTIVVPVEYQGDYAIWQGTNKELSLLLKSLDSIVTIPSTGFAISTDNIDLRDVLSNKNEILKSAILTATITDKIISVSPTITIPSEKIVNSSMRYDTDYGFWKNEYSTDYSAVTSYGELSHILSAMDIICGISTSETAVSIDSLTTKLDNIYIEDIYNDKTEILKSYILSSTIVDKIVSLDGSGLTIPSSYKVTSSNDYDNWMNNYDSSDAIISRGEIDRLLVSVYNILGLSSTTKTSLSSFDVTNSVDNMISKILTDSTKEYRNNLLSSMVVSETIVSKVSSIKSLKDGSKDYISDTETNQASLNNTIVLSDSNNRSDWYSLDSNGIPEEKELWNLLTSVAILIGNSSVKLSEVDDFSIDTLLKSNVTISYDSSYDVTNSDVEVMLKSYIMEEVFAKLAQDLFTSTTSTTIFDSTMISNFNYYKNSVNVKTYNEEYDLQKFLESFYIMNRHIDYYNLTSNVSIIKELGTDAKLDDLNDFAAAMVISRVFKASTANIGNTLFASYYASLVSTTPTIYSTHPYNDLTKFVQTDYSDPITKVVAHDSFVTNYRIICNEYSSLS